MCVAWHAVYSCLRLVDGTVGADLPANCNLCAHSHPTHPLLLKPSLKIALQGFCPNHKTSSGPKKTLRIPQGLCSHRVCVPPQKKNIVWPRQRLRSLFFPPCKISLCACDNATAVCCSHQSTYDFPYGYCGISFQPQLDRNATATTRGRQLGSSGRPTQTEPFARRSREKGGTRKR